MAQHRENGFDRALARARRKFKPVWSEAVAEYREADGIEEKRRARAWWSKKDIVDICDWPVQVFGWKPLRRELYMTYGLVHRSRGIPRGEEDRARVRCCWTIPIGPTDRTRLVRAEMRRQTTNLGNAIFYLEEGARPGVLHEIDVSAMDELREELEDSNISLDRLLRAYSELTDRVLATEVLALMEAAGER